MNSLWASFLLSFEIALAAAALTCVIGVPLAFGMARRRFFGKGLLEALILMPLVLPPTVVGYILLVIFGAQGWPGKWLKEHFDFSIVFTFEGAVLAALVVSMPLLYLPAKAAFQEVDRDLEDVARMMGANRVQMFWHVSLPLARRGILAGVLLAFARALGEFGATAMVYGMRSDRLTLPISIYVDSYNNDWLHALPAMMALTLASLGVILAYNYWSRGAE